MSSVSFRDQGKMAVMKTIGMRECVDWEAHTHTHTHTHMMAMMSHLDFSSYDTIRCVLNVCSNGNLAVVPPSTRQRLETIKATIKSVSLCVSLGIDAIW